MTLPLDFWIKQGDLLPNLDITLGVDLTSAVSVNFTMASADGTVLVNSATAAVDGAAIQTPSTGEVIYSWQDGDTDVPSSVAPHRGEIQVIWAGGPETYPNDGYINIHILPANVPAD